MKLLPSSRSFPGCWWLLLLVGLLIPQTTRAEATLAYVKGRMIYTARAADGRNERKICVGNSPCISHDGCFLAYTRTIGTTYPDGTRTIVVRELASGMETDLPNGPVHQTFGALWSPDDAWIAYNALSEHGWQVAVAHRDGSAFHWLTDRLPDHEGGYYLAGWNLHDGAVLAHNMHTAAQLDPATGEAAWTRLLVPLIDGQIATSDTAFTICGDGQRLVYTHTTDPDEIPYLARGAESPRYLAVGDLAAGGTRRLTPKRFNVVTSYVSTDGGSIFLWGFRRQDGKVLRDGGVEIKQRLYRCDLLTGQLTPLVEGGERPSVSRD